MILFGARWCAPCAAEYRTLPALAAAAAPDRTVLAWVDRPIVPPASMTGVGMISAEAARALARRIAGEGYGLPLSALLDGAARPCAVWRGPLRPADLVELRRRCDGGR